MKRYAVASSLSLLIAAGCGSNPQINASGSGTPSQRNQTPAAYYVQTPVNIPQTLNDSFYASTGVWSPVYQDLWGHIELGVAGLYSSLQLPAQDIVVAVVDTGIDMDHEDLSGRLWVNPGEMTPTKYDNKVDDDGNGFVDDIIGWDWINNGNNPLDDNGHGTHVAGTIAAIGGNAKGIVGVSPWVRIMPLKACDYSGACDSQDVRDAIHYAAHNGAKIINLSLGGPDDGVQGPAFDSVIQDAWQSGALVVVSAGNDAMDALDYAPANARFAMAVAASRSDGKLCGFSDYGWKVDLAAPGCGESAGQDVAGILSLNSQKCGVSGTLPCAPPSAAGANYVLKSGTSMSAPHVSGLAAVAWTISPAATPLQIRQAVLKAAAPAAAAGTKNFAWGFGAAGSKNLLDWAKEAPGIKITTATPNAAFRVEARDAPVSWSLSLVNVAGLGGTANVDLTSGSVQAAGTVDAGTAVNLTQKVSLQTGQVGGPYLLILEATASGDAYYDTAYLQM